MQRSFRVSPMEEAVGDLPSRHLHAMLAADADDGATSPG
jgi:hypothetical protein